MNACPFNEHWFHCIYYYEPEVLWFLALVVVSFFGYCFIKALR